MMTGVARAFCITAALALLTLLPIARRSARASSVGTIGPKEYYLALGDSLAYGFQINLDFDDGYANDFYDDLETRGTAHLINMGCFGETSNTFINGGCLGFLLIRKYPYLGPQLAAALNFIHNHADQVSPVTLDIGANDFLLRINPFTCNLFPGQSFDQILATFDGNITNILAQLKAALNGTGDLLVMNYYFPYQNECPALVPQAQTFNSHIAADAAQYGVPVADVFTAFGGAATPNPNLCAYTWECNLIPDVHPTNQGYSVIARALEATAGY